MNLLTMPSASGSSWPRGTPPNLNNFPVHLILFRVTFFLFSELKGIIKKIHFESTKAIKTAVTTELWDILEESFQQCIETIQKRMWRCIRLKGDYFEGEIM